MNGKVTEATNSTGIAKSAATKEYLKANPVLATNEKTNGIERVKSAAIKEDLKGNCNGKLKGK